MKKKACTMGVYHYARLGGHHLTMSLWLSLLFGSLHHVWQRVEKAEQKRQGGKGRAEKA